MLHDRTQTMPQSWGLCRYCLREMWSGSQIPRGKCRVSADRVKCCTCERWIERYADDPRHSKSSVAETVPAERPDPGPTDWKASPDRRCAGVPTGFFEPELSDDDPQWRRLASWERKALWAQRRRVAAGLCASCPFITQCRANAAEMGFEGLWGGVWFDRREWEDLRTGERGPTIHAPRRTRERFEARQKAAA